MLRSYAAELGKVVRRPAAGLLLGVWLVLMLVFLYLLPYLSYRSATNPRVAQRLLGELLPQSLPAQAISGYPLWGGALVVALGALCVGSEYGWGTLKTMLSNRPGRLHYYLAQLAALATLVAALVVGAFALSGLAGVLVGASAGASITLPSAGALAQSMGGGWLILFMWCLFGVVLAVAVRGTALSIGLGLVWVMAVETVVRAFAPEVGILGTLEKGLPGTAAASLAGALGSTGAGATSILPGGAALLLLLLFLLLFGGVGGFLLERRDVA